MSRRPWRVHLIGAPFADEWVAIVTHVTGPPDIRVRVSRTRAACDQCGPVGCEHLRAAARQHRKITEGKD